MSPSQRRERSLASARRVGAFLVWAALVASAAASQVAPAPHASDVGQSAGQTEGFEASLPIEIVSINVEGRGAAPPRLKVRLHNRASVPVAGWTFAVELDGLALDGYRDLLFFVPLAPGARGEVELLRPPAGGSEIRVSIVEAFAAELVAEPSDVPEAPDRATEVGTWRLLDPLAGAPSRRTRTLSAPR
ncbi:MAG: hypothetical protein AAGM22_11470 [Acidobacteriota bacterium]